MQNYADALAEYNKALQIEPHCSNCYMSRGVLKVNVQGDAAGAFEYFNLAIENDPFNARAYANRAVSYLDQGQTHLALPDFHLPLEIAPKYHIPQSNHTFLYS